MTNEAVVPFQECHLLVLGSWVLNSCNMFEDRGCKVGKRPVAKRSVDRPGLQRTLNERMIMRWVAELVSSR